MVSVGISTSPAWDTTGLKVLKQAALRPHYRLGNLNVTSDLSLKPTDVRSHAFFCKQRHFLTFLISTSAFQIIGQRDINNDKFLTIVGTLAAVTNMFARLVWGRVADRVHFRVS